MNLKAPQPFQASAGQNNLPQERLKGTFEFEHGKLEFEQSPHEDAEESQMTALNEERKRIVE